MRAVLDQEPVRRDLGHAAHEADQQDAPAPAERRQRRVEQRAAHRIEADIGGLAASTSWRRRGNLAPPAGMSFARPAPSDPPTSPATWPSAGGRSSGRNLLVLGAAGGVGLTAVEIGQGHGRPLIAARARRRSWPWPRHGADATISDYAKEPLTERVMAPLTGGKGRRCLLRSGGRRAVRRGAVVARLGGRILLIGFVAACPDPANRLLVKHRAALGSSLRYFRWHAPDKLARSVDELFRWCMARASSDRASATACPWSEVSRRCVCSPSAARMAGWWSSWSLA